MREEAGELMLSGKADTFFYLQGMQILEGERDGKIARIRCTQRSCRFREIYIFTSGLGNCASLLAAVNTIEVHHSESIAVGQCQQVLLIPASNVLIILA